MVENIDKIIADQAEAGNLYLKKDDATRLILVADSKEAAHELCEKFILNQWDGKQRTVKLLTTAAQSHLRRGQMKASLTLFRSMHSRISESRL
ncbi:MAG: hypothetical protein ACLUE2_14455 [Bacteroides cellulosilyticus]